MDHNFRSTFTYFYGIILVSVLLFTCIGCDSILPDEYKAKNFDAPDVDKLAGNLLTRDTVNDAQGNTISYQYYPITTTRFTILPVTWTYDSSRTLESFAPSGETADNQIIYANFSSIVSSLSTLKSDSLILLKYPANKSISYAVLNASSSKDIHIYASLQYYWTSSANNVNEYVTIDLIKSDTTLVNASTVIPAEVAYNSVENVMVNGASLTIPVINTRYTAHLDQGVYLIRFTLSNPATISNPLKQPSSAFKLPSIANQIKVVILSY